MANDINNNGSLFNEEQLNEMSESQSNVLRSGPVTVLGMTFPNDEERRRFFRDELRKKLPELRKIEGFPIGEDDDIINLSDPPYYTASPNPWLNDFITQWEQEKTQLEAEGKRKTVFEVTEPYSSDVSEGKNNPVYMAHAYHTKVPHPAIMRYILHYTQPGDIVFDGFCGTGMTGVAANMCEDDALVSALGEKNAAVGKRHAICSDLSPYASTIAHFYNSSHDIKSLSDELHKIYNEVFEECRWMYTTKCGGEDALINFVVWSDVLVCPYCGATYNYWDVAKDDEHRCLADSFKCPDCGVTLTTKTSQKLFETQFDIDLKESTSVAKIVPVLIVCTGKSGKRYQIKPTQSDLDIIDRINNLVIPYYIPTQCLPDGYNIDQPKRSDNILKPYQFYTKRNLYTLSSFYDKVNKSRYSTALRYIFTSMIGRSTKMNRFSPRNFFYGGGGWCLTGLNGTLYVPLLPMEVSVLAQLSGKLNIINSLSQFLNHDANGVCVTSATHLTLKDNSIDYIFVDPPFGANIMYSDLNIIAESWLRVFTNNTSEAIVNEYQHKNLFDYQVLMNRSLREFYRVLKPGKWLTMEFSNTSAAVWNSIQNALQGVGFVVASVSALDKKQGSFKAVTTTTAVKQDLIISCFKPTAEMIERFETSGDIPENAWAFIEMLLSRLDTVVVRSGELQIMPERTPRILFDKLVSYYVAHGFAVPMSSQDFQQGLHERFIERDGMYFTPNQALEYEDQKKVIPVGAEISIYISSEREGIEWLRRQLIKPQTYSELTNNWMSMLQKPKKGDQIPELMDVLKENFIKEEDGKWVIPDRENQAHLTIMRNKRLRKQFDMFVEQAGRARKLTDTNLEALRYGFTECYKEKDFATIVKVAEKLPEALLMEDEVLLQFYDIAISRV